MWSAFSAPVAPIKRRNTENERMKFFEQNRSTVSGRLLLADRRAPFEHFWPKNLLLSAFHAVAFTAAPALAAVGRFLSFLLACLRVRVRVGLSGCGP